VASSKKVPPARRPLDTGETAPSPMLRQALTCLQFFGANASSDFRTQRRCPRWHPAPSLLHGQPSVLACASKRMRGSCIRMTSAVPSVAPTSMTTQVFRSGRARCRWPLHVGCVVECAKRTLTSGLPPARERAPPPPLGLHRPARDTHDWSRRPARPRPHMLLLPPCSRRRPFLREHTERSLRTKPRDGHARYVTPGLT